MLGRRRLGVSCARASLVGFTFASAVVVLAVVSHHGATLPADFAPVRAQAGRDAVGIRNGFTAQSIHVGFASLLFLLHPRRRLLVLRLSVRQGRKVEDRTCDRQNAYCLHDRSPSPPNASQAI